jgi:hypothetical protein
VTLTGWIFMVGLRVFDIGALVVWLVWFFRQRDDEDDDNGGGPGGPGRGGDPDGGPPLPDADPWPERRRDHLGDRPSSTQPTRPRPVHRPAPSRIRTRAQY